MIEKDCSKFFSVFLVFILVISLVSMTPIWEVRAERSSEADERLVLIRDLKDTLDVDELEDRGEVVDSYGNFVLFRTADLESIGSSDEYDVDRLEHRNELNVKGYGFDTSEGYPDMNEELILDGYEPGTEGLYLIDMIGPINPEWRMKLEEIGVELINYVPNYAFEARMTPEQAEQVEEKFFVDWVDVYQPQFKLTEDLEPGLVNVVLVEEPSLETLNAVSQSARVLSSTDLTTYGTQVRVEVEETSTFSELARIEEVYHISEHIEPELHDEVSTQTIGGGHWIWDPDDDPYVAWRGYDEEYDYGAHVNHLGYSGDGLISIVADTGIHETHEDFQDRVVGGYYWGSGDDYTDGHGHGTHVAGSVAGDTYRGTKSLSQELHEDIQIEDYYAAQGLAYESELYSARIFDENGMPVTPEDTTEIVTLPRDELGPDAYIHANSWGAPSEGAYTESDRDYDSVVRDAGDGEPMIITVSSGNEGDDGDEDNPPENPVYQTTGSPGNAKNVITVGASETFYPGLVPYAENYEADPDRTATFSSRGWTEDGRVKPEVMAPGLFVWSTGNDDDTDYYATGGTSMSQPAVNGAAGVVVEWYEEQYGERPSPAMVKALMINTASQMEPQAGDFYTDHIPNRDEGWGMVNLPALMDAESEFLLEDQDSLLQTGDVEEYTLSYDNPSEPLKVSLTWTDEEAQVDDFDVLKNDLNLEVEASDGSIYRGNAFSEGWTQPEMDTMDVFDDTGDGWDDTNNVENVYIHPDGLEEGDYTIRVIGENIPADSNNDGTANQDYALVTYNVDEAGPPQISLESPEGGEYWQFGEDRDVAWDSEEGAGSIIGVDLEYTIDGGDTWDTIEEGLESTGVYTWEIPEQPTDRASVQATVHDDEGYQTSEASDEFIITKLYSPAEPRPKDEETHVDIDAELSVLAEHAGFGEYEETGKYLGPLSGYDHEYHNGLDLENEYPSPFESAGNWEWLYDADWRDMPDLPIGTEEPAEWYGAMVLDLSDQVGEEITHVAYVGSAEGDHAQAFVAEEDGGAPGDWLASSDVVEPKDYPEVMELELDQPVEITDPGEYWVVVQVDDPGEVGVFGAYDGFVENAGWIAFEQPQEPEAWSELPDQGLDYSWSLEARVPKDIYFEVDIVDYEEIVNAGAEVEIEYEVTNIGEEEDTQDIEFIVNGMVEDSVEETLEGGETHEGEFTWTFEEIGEHELEVSSADESEKVTVTVEDPSEFKMDIVDHDAEVVEGEEVIVNYTAENEGDDTGTQQIDFRVDDEVKDTDEVTLEVNEEHLGQFSWIAEEPGNYVLEVASFDDEDEVTVTVELSMEVTFYDASNEVEIGRAESVGNGERADMVWEDLEYDTTYEWYAVVDDGVISERSETWSFTTEPDSHFELEMVDIEDEIIEGEQSNVTYQVTNTGEGTDEQPIEFFARGELTDTHHVELEPGESDVRMFTWVPEEPGTHSLDISSIDDSISDDYRVLEAPYFEIKGIFDHPEMIAAGTEVFMEYEVTNTGEVEDNKTIELLIDGSVEDSEDITLDEDEVHEGEFIWDTDEEHRGKYQLKIASEDSEDESSIEVVEPPTFEIEIDDMEEEHIEGDVITVSYEVKNTGEVEDTQTIDFTVGGELKASENFTLEEGDQEPGHFTWDTEDVDPRQYELRISSREDEDDLTLNVLQDAFFEVEIISTVDDEEFVEGEEITIEYEVTNTGDVEDTKTIEFFVDGELEDEEEIELGYDEPDNVHEGEFTWQTEDGDAGDYNITIMSEDDEYRTDEFTVVEEDILEGYWWIFLIIVIAVILIIVVVVRKKKGGEEAEEDVCPDCGSEMRFIEEYDRWYCDNCQDYKAGPTTPGIGAQQQPSQQQSDVCSDCGSEMRFIEEYDRWYCETCQDYKADQTTPGAGMQQQTPQQQNDVCSDCGREMRFIEEYDRWYCDNCQEYGPKGSSVAATTSQQQNNICPACGREMRFIDEYDRWYCNNCEEYQ